jgi:hypothetical protein
MESELLHLGKAERAAIIHTQISSNKRRYAVALQQLVDREAIRGSAQVHLHRLRYRVPHLSDPQSSSCPIRLT